MQDSADMPAPKAKSENTLFDMMRLGAYTIAGFTGVRLGITKIWDMAYDNFKDYKQFDALRTQRREDLAKVPKDAVVHGWDRKKIAQEIRGVERKYGQDFNAILKKDFKIDSEGAAGFLKGTVQRFETLGGYTRAKIGFAGVASTLAAVGGLVLIERYATGHSPLQKLEEAVQAKAQGDHQKRA